MEIVVTKSMSQDEQFQMKVQGKDAADIAPKLANALVLLDARLHQQGMRVVEAMKETEGLPAPVRQCINATMGILYGRPGAMQEMAVAKDFLENEAREKKYGKLEVVESDSPAPEAV